MKKPNNQTEQQPQDPRQIAIDRMREQQRALAMAVHKSFADAAKGEIDLLTNLRDEATDADEVIAYTKAIADVRMRVNEAALVTTTRLGQMGQQRQQQTPTPMSTQQRDPSAAPEITRIGEVLKARFGAQQGGAEHKGADRGSMGGDEGGNGE